MKLSVRLHVGQQAAVDFKFSRIIQHSGWSPDRSKKQVKGIVTCFGKVISFLKELGVQTTTDEKLLPDGS